MWNDRLRLAERVQEDLASLPEDERQLLRMALEQIDEDPIVGAPLFAPFQGIWSYRLARLRILYRIAPEARVVVILKIEMAEGA